MKMNKTRELVEISILTAIMFVGKEAMNSLPNIHPVMLFIILMAIEYGWKSMLGVFAFVLLELFVHGFSLWNLTYIYLWPLAAILAILFRKKESNLFWAILAGLYGLIFGALSIIPYIFITDLKTTIAFWISGISYDLIHCVSNFVICLLLLPVLTKTLRKLRKE